MLLLDQAPDLELQLVRKAAVVPRGLHDAAVYPRLAAHEGVDLFLEAIQRHIAHALVLRLPPEDLAIDLLLASLGQHLAEELRGRPEGPAHAPLEVEGGVRLAVRCVEGRPCGTEQHLAEELRGCPEGPAQAPLQHREWGFRH